MATGTPVPNLEIMWELEETPAKYLDKFIEYRLLPDTNFRRQIKDAVHIISTFLKEKCFQGAPHPVRVTKVIKVSPNLPPGEGVAGWTTGPVQTDRQKQGSSSGLAVSDISILKKKKKN